jgi:hypothetical protein
LCWTNGNFSLLQLALWQRLDSVDEEQGNQNVCKLRENVGSEEFDGFS